MCLVLAAVCIVWWLFANNSTSYPIPMAIIAMALLINARWVADYVQSRNFTWPCYLHLVVQYALVFAMLWSTVESYVQLQQVRRERCPALQNSDNCWQLAVGLLGG